MAIKPPWMETALSLIGTKEKPGKANNPVIMKWAELTNLTRTYTADSIPWCGLFVSFCMTNNGIVPVKDPLWALNWNKFGYKLSEPAYGCILAFSRNGGGHVGFYVGEDSSTFHVLGGNQSDSVNITRVAKNRCKGYRWPPGMEKFLVKGRIKQTLAGSISKNEA